MMQRAHRPIHDRKVGPMLQEKLDRIPEKAAEPQIRVVQRQPAIEAAADDSRVDLKELIRVMRPPPKSILWAAAIPVLLAILYGVLATPLYTVSTQILIDPRDRRI